MAGGFSFAVKSNAASLLAHLDRVERNIIPAALANVANRAATETRKRAIAELAEIERRPKKELRGIVTVPVRANRRKARIFATVRGEGSTSALVPLSKPFTVTATRTGKRLTVHRALEVPAWYHGPRRTPGRLHTSPPNLPLINSERQRKAVYLSRQRVVFRHGEAVTRTWIPPALAAELETQESRALARARAGALKRIRRAARRAF